MINSFLLLADMAFLRKAKLVLSKCTEFKLMIGNQGY